MAGCLALVNQQNATAVVIAPLWPSQSWYSQLSGPYAAFLKHGGMAQIGMLWALAHSPPGGGGGEGGERSGGMLPQKNFEIILD